MLLQSLPDDFDTPLFQTFSDFISEVTGANEMPFFKDVDLMKVYKIAPHLYILDVVEPGSRFRVRFAGTKMCSAVGLNPTGRFLEEVHDGPHKEHYLSAYSEMLKVKRPMRIRSTILLPKRGGEFDQKNRSVVIRRLAYPLTDTGDTMDHVMGLLVRVDGADTKSEFQVSFL